MNRRPAGRGQQPEGCNQGREAVSHRLGPCSFDKDHRKFVLRHPCLVYGRVPRIEHAGRLYLDLADEHWRAVEIGPDGWRVLECPPVRFRRSPGMLPLPVPERGGSIEALRSFLNLSNQRLRVGRRMAVGRVAIRRLSAVGDIGEQGSERRQFYQSFSGRRSIPTWPQSERCRARNPN